MSGIWRRAAGSGVILAAVVLLAGSHAVADQVDPAETPPEAVSLRFNFKGASFDQVIDYFSRATGKPVIRETDMPGGTLDFLSPETYDLDDGLRVLNIILQSRGVTLRIEDEMLYLQKLTEMQRENVPTFIGEVPSDITPEKIVTVVRPLESASAEPLAKRLAELVAEYGSVTAMAGQNSVVITETASQVRRLLKIIAELDQQAPDALVEVFVVKNASAIDLMEPLKGLLTTKVIKYMPDKKGKLQKVEEDSLSGLNIAADARTNSIIGKGPRPSLEKLRELVAVLDVAEGDGRLVRTFALSTLSPEDARKKLNDLFKRLPAERRPLAMPRSDEPSVTLIGERALVDEGARMLQALDGGVATTSSGGLVIEAVSLAQGDPDAVIEALQGLLNQRQKTLVKLVSGPDGQSLLMAGPEEDVSAVARIIPVLDRADGVEQEVRKIRLALPNSVSLDSVIKEANQLHAERLREESRLSLVASDDGRVITLIGPRREVEGWIEMATLVSEHAAPRQETRRYEVANIHPSLIVEPLRTMSAQILADPDALNETPPKVEAIDSLDMLLISAAPAQFQVIEDLLEKLDREDPADYQVRVIDVSEVKDLAMVMARARSAWERLAGDDPIVMPDIEADAQSGRLLLSGTQESVARYEQAIATFRQLEPRSDLKVLPLKHASARDVSEYLRQFTTGENGLLRAGSSNPPTIDVIDRTNALVVGGTTDQQQMILSLVQSLDVSSAGERAPLRILQLQVADAAGLAQSLSQQYDTRSVQDRASRPVQITADPNTNSLFVSAHPELVEELESIVTSLNTVDRIDRDGREIRIFPLRIARAEELARTIDEMFPEPPMPRDRRGAPMPHLQAPREVVVRADIQTNSLIVEAPVARMASFQQLVDQLDRQKVVEETEVRTYQPTHTDLSALATTLRQLADSGSLHEDTTDRRGTITIATEPSSHTLIVSGPAPVFGRVEQVLKELDVRPAIPATTLRFFKLQHADADRLAETLRGVLLVRMREELPGGAFAVETLLNVSSDEKTNTLIISAPTALMSVAESLITQLDTPAAARSIDVQVLTLSKADAGSVASTLQESINVSSRLRPGEPQASVKAQPSGNSIIVTGTPEQIEELRTVVARLDDGLASDQPQVRTVYLEHARAGSVAPIVEELLKAEVSIAEAWYSSRRGQPIPEKSQVRVQADLRLNAVVVVATPHVLAVAEQMVKQLDVDPGKIHAAARRRVQVMHVRNADARELASSLEALFSESGTTEPPTVRVDTSSNTLLVRGDEDQLARIEEVVREVDDATLGTSRQLHLIPIDPTRGDAADVAQSLRRMLDRGSGSRVEVIKLEDLLAPPAAPKKSSGDQGRGGTSVPLASLLAMALGTYSYDTSTVSPTSSLPDVSLAVDPATNSLVIVGSERAVERARAVLLQLVEQMPAAPGTVRRIELGGSADATALAQMLRQTMQQLTPSGGKRGDLIRRTSIIADERDNALVVVCTDPDFQVIGELVGALASGSARGTTVVKAYQLNSIPVDQAARSVKGLLQGDPRNRGRQASRMRSLALRTLGDETAVQAVFRPDLVSVVGDGSSNALIVMAPSGAIEFIDSFIELIDQAPVSQVATLKLFKVQHANADDLRATLRTVFKSRHRDLRRTRDGQQLLEPEFGHDQRTNMLLVTASPQHLAEVERLVKQLDQPVEDAALPLRSITLQTATPSKAAGLLEDIVFGPNPARRLSTIIVADDASGTLLVRADEGTMKEINEVLSEIDRDPTNAFEVRTITLERADAVQVASAMQKLYDDRAGMSRSRGRKGGAESRRVTIIGNPATRLLLVSASDEDFAQVEKLAKQFDSPQAAESLDIRAIPLENARATEIFQSVQEMVNQLERGASGSWWFEARTRRELQGRMAIYPDTRLNALVVSGTEDSVAMVERIVDVMDSEKTPDNQRTMKVYRADNVSVKMLENVVTDLHGNTRRRWWQPPTEQDVQIIVDDSRGALIVAALPSKHEEIASIIEELDMELAEDQAMIQTFALKGAKAREVVGILRETLQLDATGEAHGVSVRIDKDKPAVEVRGRVVADDRSNSLIVTAPPESLTVIETLVRQLDEEPAAIQVEYRIFQLEHALAEDVRWNLFDILPTMGDPSPRVSYNRIENQLIVSATPDQLKQIEIIIKEFDQPSTANRSTRFMPLKFAEAEKVREALTVFYGPYALDADTPSKLNVRIVADPASNSLVISAEEQEWEALQALIQELDAEQYDASLQLKVIPLTYADAVSVARAINDAFQQQVRRSGKSSPESSRSGSGNRDGARQDIEAPTVLVQAEDWVRASAEPLTNAVVVSATRKTLIKIETIVAQLDVSDHASLPPARLIPVRTANPERLAESVRKLYDTPAREGRVTLRIVGDVESSTLIVRAPEEDFIQIKALAKALEEHGDDGGMGVYVIRLKDAPAARVADAIRKTYATRAKTLNAPLQVEVDSATNSLVVAATEDLVDEIKSTVAQLDDLAPASGLGIFIIELQHVDPAEAIRVIKTIGLDRPQPEGSLTRLLGEPIRVSPLQGRRAVVVVASPADEKTVTGIFKALDAEPKLATATMQVVLLKNAKSTAIAALLEEVLSPASQQVDTPMARAVQEQIRRLAVHQDGVNQPDFGLDLTQPIRIIPHETRNALLVSSSDANVAAVVELVAMLDQLPVTEAVIVRMFPLENIAANEFARIIRSLFDQGKALGGVPGAELFGVPAGSLGRALLDQVAIAVDERTNTVVIAGKEDSVAAVEVISSRLDSDLQSGWIEPRLVSLTWADADELAMTLNRVLVEGATDLPQAGPLQRQVGRLRMARMESSRVIESEVFQPMQRLIIEPQSQMRALMLVGPPVNLDLVSELIALLDVEAASPASTVRIYPVEHASAARLSSTINLLFREQVSTGAIRKEDRVVIQADERTNALVVTTSARSFAVVESLLQALDSEMNPDLQEIRRLPVTHASAARLADVVQRLMDARVERLRLVEPETADLQRATIIPDDRTNTLVIAAGNESYDVIQMLVEQMDEANVLDNALVDVVGVGDSNPDRLASAINSIMERRYADLPSHLKNRRQPLVMTDPRTSSLLISADPEDLAAIQKLVEQLMATPIAQAVDLHVIPVASGSNADRLAPRLQQLMRDRQQSLGEAATPSDRVSVTAEIASNSLIVAASRENLVIVQEMVTLLVEAEAESTAGREFEVLALRSSSAEELVDVLNELYVEEANRNRGSGTVRVSSEPRLNSIIISAPRTDIAALRMLVARLDGAKPAHVIEIRHFPLKSANALETVRLIEEVLSGRGIGSRSRSTQQTTVLRYVREIEDAMGETEFQVSAALRESISLTPDIRTNTVIVRAPRESIELIGRMIRDLDDSSEGSKNIRIFKLKNADALAMREVLIDLFRLDEGEDLLVLKPRDSSGINVPGMEGIATIPGSEDIVGGTELTAVPDPRQQLAITVDSRTNSLLVSGSPAYLDLVENVVNELDELEANERETFVYQLRNATAENVASVLGEFVAEEQRKLVQTLGGDQIGSAARLLEREITIRGDQKSNTVLVSTSPRYMERIEDVIRQLDVDPPQVLIQLMLAEVTLEGGFDWGISVDASGDIGTVRLGGLYDLVAGTMAMGAPTLSIASSDFNIMLRALEKQNRLNILSNPSIIAANNEQATINVGETIYLPTASQTYDTGLVSVPLEAKETGVILDVTPSINPDGFVRLDVTPTLSRVTDQRDEPAVGVTTPRIQQRTADTTVTVYDGQTIILGGLILEEYEYNEQSIPFLGDLPLIGFLFRGETENLRRTELVIVLTPHVIRSPADHKRITDLTNQQVDLISVPEPLQDQIRKGRFDGEGIFDKNGDELELKDFIELEKYEGVRPEDTPEPESDRGDE
ncbi:MAG: secretin N-terminal domain-containing protein [Planctomycetota bacterium]|nr:secretin N-terminal domain-containing protein [Planctomycetota bacterium]